MSDEIPKKVLRVARYIRVSTEDQAKDGYSLESQSHNLKVYIQSFSDIGWTTSDELEYIDDGISGSTEVSERPALSRLVADMYAGKFEVLLVWRIDRLFRKVAYLLEFIEGLKGYGVNFVSKNENIDVMSPTGKLVLAILGAISEMERDLIADRTAEWKRFKALDGYIVYGRSVPYGFALEHDGRGNKLKVLPEEAEIVREIFKMYVDGFSANEIAKILTNRKVGSSVDRMVAEGEGVRKKRNPGFFHSTLVAGILKNETYLGRYVCNRRETKKAKGKTTVTLKDPSEWITIPCDRIVDDATFAKAQAIRAKACVMRGRGEPHLFTGIVKCGSCGRSLNFYLSRKMTGNWRCSGKKRDKNAPENYCKNPDISERKLIEIVWPKVEEFLNNPEEAVKAYEARMQKTGEREREAALVKESADLDASMAAKLKARKDAFKVALEHPELTADLGSIAEEFARDVQALEKKREAVQADLRAIKERKGLLESVLALSGEFKKKLGEITEKERDAYIKRLTHLVEVFPDKARVVYKFER